MSESRTPGATAPSPSAPPSLSVSPVTAVPAPQSPPAPISTAVDVAFTGLPQGSFPAHVHSRCDGSQAFHIAVIGSVTAGPDGSGVISVPEGYFGRGLCVILYTDTTFLHVLALRAI